MGRFINLGIAIVNTSYIIRVEMESDGRAEIYMSDGTMFRCDHFDASQLYGTNGKKEGATSLHLQEELRYDQSHSTMPVCAGASARMQSLGSISS